MSLRYIPHNIQYGKHEIKHMNNNKLTHLKYSDFNTYIIEKSDGRIFRKLSPGKGGIVCCSSRFCTDGTACSTLYPCSDSRFDNWLKLMIEGKSTTEGALCGFCASPHDDIYSSTIEIVVIELFNKLIFNNVSSKIKQRKKMNLTILLNDQGDRLYIITSLVQMRGLN